MYTKQCAEKFGDCRRKESQLKGHFLPESTFRQQDVGHNAFGKLMHDRPKRRQDTGISADCGDNCVNDTGLMR